MRKILLPLFLCCTIIASAQPAGTDVLRQKTITLRRFLQQNHYQPLQWKPTKDEINTFNKAVNEVNSGVKTFNDSNNALYQTRNQLLESWDSTVDGFFDNHMPTYK